MDQDLDLGALARMPLLNIYMQICLCFPVPDASLHGAIIDTLTDGLKRLSESFPWVAGQVVNEGSGEGDSGIFKIRPLESIPRLVVKDLRHDPSISMPSMDDLRQANFPFSMLNENILSARRIYPGDPEEAGLDSTPVLILQANFITGGLLLTFTGHHTVMDMTGQGQIIHLFSKACCNEPFTSEELTFGNLRRHDLIPLLDETCKLGPQLSYNISDPTVQKTIDLNSRPKTNWVYFTFSPASLNTLKSLASESLPSSSPASFISTDDALTALIWKSINRARSSRFKPTDRSIFARSVNVRQYLDIPATFPGIGLNMSYFNSTFQEVLDAPLGSIASQFRSVLDPATSDLAYSTRALATYLDRTPDTGDVSYAAYMVPGKDLIISSWAKLNCYELDFNMGLGKPEAVRTLWSPPFEGLLYLMPRSLDGGIAAGIALREEDIERLKDDEEFVKYGKYVG